MATIFGIDLQELIADAVAAAGGLNPGVLTKSIAGGRESDNPTRAVAPTTTEHTLEAVVESKAVRLEGSDIASVRPVMTIVGGSVTPLAEPEVNDTVTIGGLTFTLNRLISVDPAKAAYEFEVT